MKFPHVLRGQFHSRLLSAKTDGQGVFDTAYLESGYQKSKLPGGSSNDYDGACVQNVQDALVQHYPLLYILDRRDNPVYIFVPLMALWFLIPSYALWRYGVRKYKSSGS